MVERAIIWTDTAQKQRRLILLYWTKRNKSTVYAEKLLDQIAHHTKLLALYPEAFPATDYLDTRVSSIGHFSLFYQVSQKQIIITGFWDNRQDPSELVRLLE